MQILAKYVLPLIILMILGNALGDVSNVLFQIGISAGFVYYLFLGTDNKHWLREISISIAPLPIIELLLQFGLLNEVVGMVMTYISAISTAVFYFLRFWNKSNRWTILELLKLLAIIQLGIAYSINMLEYGRISVAILGFVYLTTRTSQIENASNMARNLITGLLILISVFFLVFAHIKSSEAERQASMAAYNHNEMQKSEQLMNEKMIHLEQRLTSLQNQLNECQAGN